LSGGAIEYRANSECNTVQEASGVPVAWSYCRDETKRYSGGASKLTSEEARRFGKAISRIPEFMKQRQDFIRVGKDRDGAPPDKSPSWSRRVMARSSPPASATLAASLSRARPDALPDAQRSGITTDRVHDLLEEEAT
jgi:hypothetical protein